VKFENEAKDPFLVLTVTINDCLDEPLDTYIKNRAKRWKFYSNTGRKKKLYFST